MVRLSGVGTNMSVLRWSGNQYERLTRSLENAAATWRLAMEIWSEAIANAGFTLEEFANRYAPAATVPTEYQEPGEAVYETRPRVSFDFAEGRLIDELIPEAVREWKELRELIESERETLYEEE